MSVQKRLGAACAGLAVGGAVVLAGVGSALACLPAPEQIEAAYPGAAEVVAPDALLWLFSSGGRDEPTIELRDADGVVVDADVVTNYLASSFAIARSVSPTMPLEEGSYVLHAEGPGGSFSFERNFEVDPQLAWPAPPAAPALSWFRETHDEPTGNSCAFGDEYHSITLSPVADAVAYRIELESDGNFYEQIGLMGDADVTHGIIVSDVSCVRAYALRGDGVASEATELCVPDKCSHFGAEEVPGALGTTDWESVEGCPGEDPDEGDSDDSDVGSEPDVDGGEEPDDDAGEDPDDDAGEDPDDDAGEDPDVGQDPDTGAMDSGSDSNPGESVTGGGCSSSGGSGGSGALALMVAALGALVWRRR